MAAPTGYPSWAYNSAWNGQPNAFQAPQVVQTLAQFNALGGPGTWSATPFPPSTTPVPSPPFDTVTNGTGTLQVTDIRLQQMLIEMRASNYLLSTMAGPFNADDPQTVMRPDILANDASLTS
jgi:hypothetical protein